MGLVNNHRKVIAVILTTMFLFTYNVFFIKTSEVSGCFVPTTKLEICNKEVECTVEKTTVYDWEITKKVDQETVTLKPKEYVDLNYTVEANRIVKCNVEKATVTGSIDVANAGCNPTKNLKIKAWVIYTTSTWAKETKTVPGSEKIINTGNLAGELPGLSKCNNNHRKDYPYTLSFTPVKGAKAYNVILEVTITNYDGHGGTAFGPDKAGKYIWGLDKAPQRTTETIKDEAATVIDEITQVPEGFSVSSKTPISSWTINDSNLVKGSNEAFSAKKTYKITLTNNSVTKAGTYNLNNKATLTKNDTEETRTACQTVCITTAAQGITATGCITATNFWKKGISYDWTIAKKANPTSLILKKDETKEVAYTLTATRTLNKCAVEETKGVKGSITVQNNGTEATKDLQIAVQLMSKVGNEYKAITGAIQQITPKNQLAAGAKGEYDYCINYNFNANTGYKVVAKVTMTNYNGHTGTAYGINPERAITLKAKPDETAVDRIAAVEDTFTDVAGFKLEGATGGFWIIGEKDLVKSEDNHIATKSYKVKVTNVSAEEGKTYTLKNTAVLTEGDTEEEHQAEANVCITTVAQGLKLEGDITATNFWNKKTPYDWTIAKEANPTSLILRTGETKEVDYTLTATRTLNKGEAKENKGVKGSITVQNNGTEATKDLQIAVQLMSKVGNEYKAINGAIQQITPKNQLAAGAKGEYDYSINYAFNANTEYKVVAKVTVTNYDNHGGIAYGINPEKGIALEAKPDETIEDREADVVDDFTDVAGFKLEGGIDGVWKIKEDHLAKSGDNDIATKSYKVKVTNVSAEGGKEYTLKNTAVLTESDTKKERTAEANVCITAEAKGITLEGCLAATSFWNKGTIYDWTIVKEANPDSLRFTSRSSKTVDYKLTATRALAKDSTETRGVKGLITVKNTGNEPTQNLQLNVQVMVKEGTGYKAIDGVTQKIVPTQQLTTDKEGNTGKYEYSIDFKAVAGAEYKVAVKATVTNYKQQEGKAAGIDLGKEFALPTAPQEKTVDRTATVTDSFNVPDGFTITGELTAPWEITEKDLIKSGDKHIATKSYQVTVTNSSARYNNTYALINTAELIENDNREVRKAQEEVNITTKRKSSGGGGSTPSEPIDPPIEEPPATPPTPPAQPTPPAPPVEPITPPVEPEPKLPNTGGSTGLFVSLGMSLVAYGSWLKYK